MSSDARKPEGAIDLVRPDLMTPQLQALVDIQHHIKHLSGIGVAAQIQLVENLRQVLQAMEATAKLSAF